MANFKDANKSVTIACRTKKFKSYTPLSKGLQLNDGLSEWQVAICGSGQGVV